MSLMQAISRRYLSSLRRGGHYELLKYRGMSTGQDAVDTMKQVTQVAHETKQKEPMVTIPGQAFIGDYRSTSAVGTGDGLSSHTAKWWQPELGGNQKSPLEYCQSAEPIKVDGMVVASTGSDDFSLGCPVEYISLKGTTRENPAVCKYTGLKYYSDAWKHGGSH